MSDAITLSPVKGSVWKLSRRYVKVEHVSGNDVAFVRLKINGLGRLVVDPGEGVISGALVRKYKWSKIEGRIKYVARSTIKAQAIIPKQTGSPLGSGFSSRRKPPISEDGENSVFVLMFHNVDTSDGLCPWAIGLYSPTSSLWYIIDGLRSNACDPPTRWWRLFAK